MSKESTMARQPEQNPIGTPTKTASRRRRARSATYRREEARVARFEGIARLIIMRRGELGLSQQELADRADTTKSAISRVESGRHPVTVQTLRKLADALDTHLVIGFSEDPVEDSTELVAV
jgi:ribosome-binding protein aMBF1 (putative translation factor)